MAMDRDARRQEVLAKLAKIDRQVGASTGVMRPLPPARPQALTDQQLDRRDARRAAQAAAAKEYLPDHDNVKRVLSSIEEQSGMAAKRGAYSKPVAREYEELVGSGRHAEAATYLREFKDLASPKDKALLERVQGEHRAKTSEAKPSYSAQAGAASALSALAAKSGRAGSHEAAQAAHEKAAELAKGFDAEKDHRALAEKHAEKAKKLGERMKNTETSTLARLQQARANMQKIRSSAEGPDTEKGRAAFKEMVEARKAHEAAPSATLERLQKARANFEKIRSSAEGPDTEKGRAAFKELVDARKAHEATPEGAAEKNARKAEDKQRALQTGARGGQYYVSESGEKVYVGKK